MRLAAVAVSVLLLACFAPWGRSAAQPPSGRPEVGDLVFLESRSAQSSVVRAVTGSRWTHVGVVVLEGGRVRVIEAAGRVRETPLARFVARGGAVAWMRLREPSPSRTGGATRLAAKARAFLGRPYDARFEWGDGALYCSELVWKVYRNGLGVRLGEPRRFADLDLSSLPVRRLAARRLGRQPDPDEPVVSPADLARSERLRVVDVAW